MAKDTKISTKTREEIQKEIEDRMELFYQRDRKNTDLLFKEIQDKISKVERLLEKVVKILDKII